MSRPRASTDAPPARPIHAHYLTVVPLISAGNGGSLCCRNHVERLAQAPGVDLTVTALGPAEWEAGTRAFLGALGVAAHFVPFAARETSSRAPSRAGGLVAAARQAIRFPWEDQAAAQSHVRSAVADLIRSRPADVIVVDYLPTLLFLPTIPPEMARVLISLNREAAFMREQIDLGYLPNGRIAAEIAWRRLKRFETRAYRRADQAVFLSLMDVPRDHLPAPARCLTPYLDPVNDGWRRTGGRSTFFIGNFGHHPNRYAIEWLARDLAPHLWRLAPDIRINIIGATAEDVAMGSPPSPNLVFLGAGDDKLAAQMFRTCDLVLCPVANDFGVKFKALEALAYGAPLLASPATLRGLPHLEGGPTLDLTRPDWSAAVIKSLIDAPERLDALQSRQQIRQAQFIASQATAWSDVLQSAIVARHRRSRQRQSSPAPT